MRRLREWYRSLREPTHVEKASKSERRKRTAWMLVSTWISFILAVAPVLAVEAVVDLALGPVGYVIGAVVGILFLTLDYHIVFPWGLDRFDIVEPWQFRDARAAEEADRR